MLKITNDVFNIYRKNIFPLRHPDLLFKTKLNQNRLTIVSDYFQKKHIPAITNSLKNGMTNSVQITDLTDHFLIDIYASSPQSFHEINKLSFGFRNSKMCKTILKYNLDRSDDYYINRVIKVSLLSQEIIPTELIFEIFSDVKIYHMKRNGAYVILVIENLADYYQSFYKNRVECLNSFLIVEPFTSKFFDDFGHPIIPNALKFENFPTNTTIEDFLKFTQIENYNHVEKVEYQEDSSAFMSYFSDYLEYIKYLDFSSKYENSDIRTSLAYDLENIIYSRCISRNFLLIENFSSTYNNLYHLLKRTSNDYRRCGRYINKYGTISELHRTKNREFQAFLWFKNGSILDGQRIRMKFIEHISHDPYSKYVQTNSHQEYIAINVDKSEYKDKTLTNYINDVHSSGRKFGLIIKSCESDHFEMSRRKFATTNLVTLGEPFRVDHVLATFPNQLILKKSDDSEINEGEIQEYLEGFNHRGFLNIPSRLSGLNHVSIKCTSQQARIMLNNRNNKFGSSISNINILRLHATVKDFDRVKVMLLNAVRVFGRSEFEYNLKEILRKELYLLNDISYRYMDSNGILSYTLFTNSLPSTIYLFNLFCESENFYPYPLYFKGERKHRGTAAILNIPDEATEEDLKKTFLRVGVKDFKVIVDQNRRIVSTPYVFPSNINAAFLNRLKIYNKRLDVRYQY